MARLLPLAKAPDLPAEEARAALADAQAEANRMGRLVGDLLTLARSDAALQLQQTQDNIVVNGYKKNGGEMQLVDLDSLLLEVFRQFHPALENDNIDVRQQGPGLLLQHITSARVHGDADQLKQVLVALLDNALKYTPYEGSISLSLTTGERSAIVKVSDTGIVSLPTTCRTFSSAFIAPTAPATVGAAAWPLYRASYWNTRAQ